MVVRRIFASRLREFWTSSILTILLEMAYLSSIATIAASLMEHAAIPGAWPMSAAVLFGIIVNWGYAFRGFLLPEDVAEYVKEGNVELITIRPKPLKYLWLREVSFTLLFRIIFSTVILLAAAYVMGYDVLLVLLTVVAGNILLLLLRASMTALTFWTGESIEGAVYPVWRQLDWYPTDLLHGSFAEALAIYVIPVYFATTLPVKVALGFPALHWEWGVAYAVILAIIVKITLKKGVESYEGAGG